MKVTRRGMMLGALAVPAAAGLANWQWQMGGNSSLLHDDTLAAGRRFADAARASGGYSRAITGDMVRLGREVVADAPALIAGISRHAEALLLGEVAAEAGYVLASEFLGKADGCSANTCHSHWLPLNRMAVAARGNWAETLAAWAVNPQRGEWPAATGPATSDREMAIGWVLVPRA
ncbi:hypothetical protein [Alteraurantiacibacter aquimixticola]|uniref:Uncharacterized protein n=1 Tax=Alteraurantiacibacter aquimixticola TaxID=2489173 RepID=A0A4T3EYA5_9SPHN|nr:hypothetical protein [Alteraurantiacibacter aquimixticola]TIX49586.1 hypothetical protein E5222_12170 [Alteraurantiacibacter aquimixticola]